MTSHLGAFASSNELSEAVWIKTSTQSIPSTNSNLVFRKGIPYLVQPVEPYLQRIVIDGKTAVPEQLPPKVVPLIIGSTEFDGLFYVYSENDKFVLFVERNNQKIELPSEIEKNEIKHLRISVNKDGNVCLTDSRKIYFRDKVDWNRVEISRYYRTGLIKVVNSQRSVYLGFSCGESGGLLLVLDKEKQKFQTPLVGYNIFDMCLDSKDRLWIVCSTWDMLRTHGVLCKYENGECSTIIENWGDWKRNGEATLSPASINWKLEPCTFDYVYADSNDDLYLGTCKHGIYKFNPKGTSQVSDSLWGNIANTNSCTKKLLPLADGFLFLVPDSGVYFQKRI